MLFLYFQPQRVRLAWWLEERGRGERWLWWRETDKHKEVGMREVPGPVLGLPLLYLQLNIIRWETVQVLEDVLYPLHVRMPQQTTVIITSKPAARPVSTSCSPTEEYNLTVSTIFWHECWVANTRRSKLFRPENCQNINPFWPRKSVFNSSVGMINPRRVSSLDTFSKLIREIFQSLRLRIFPSLRRRPPALYWSKLAIKQTNGFW